MIVLFTYVGDLQLGYICLSSIHSDQVTINPNENNENNKIMRMWPPVHAPYVN